MSEEPDSENGEFVSNPNTRTLHRGTREVGAQCGAYCGSGWASVDASNPAEAVLVFGTPPCTSCFRHSGQLSQLYRIEHSSTLTEKTVEEVCDYLPWDVPEKYLDGQAMTDGGQSPASSRGYRAQRALEALEPTHKLTMRSDAVGALKWAEEEIEEYLEDGDDDHLETAREVLQNHRSGAVGDARDHFDSAIEFLEDDDPRADGGQVQDPDSDYEDEFRDRITFVVYCPECRDEVGRFDDVAEAAQASEDHEEDEGHRAGLVTGVYRDE